MRSIQAIFALAVIILAGIGIYVMFGKSGNMILGAGDLVSEQCSEAVARAQSLDGVVGGDLAALQLADKAHYIGDLQFKDRDGNPKKLSDWRGKSVLLNLWATWCAPCRREMPALDALEKAEGGEAFQVVPVSVDLGTPDKSLAFYREIGLETLPFFADGTMVIFNELKKRSLAFGMPSSLIVDRDGCVLGVLNGPAEWAGDDALKLIRTVKELPSG